MRTQSLVPPWFCTTSERLTSSIFGQVLSRNVIVSSWFLLLDLISCFSLPSKTYIIRFVCGSITRGVWPETGGRFMVAWKLPKHVAWLSNDVNIYCHCHRPREITQIQPGYRSCSLYRVTCSTLPLALNLRYCITAGVNEMNFSFSPNTAGRGREPVADVSGFLFLAPQIPAGLEPHRSDANSVVPQLP